MAILVGLVGCAKAQAPAGGPAPTAQKKPRVELTVVLNGAGGAADERTVALSTADLPAEPRLVPRGGVTLGVVGLPTGLPLPEAIAHLEKQIPDSHRAGADATVVLSERCLPELAPTVLKNRGHWWSLALVTGRACGGGFTSPIGVTALVEATPGARVAITLDRNTGALLKVAPATGN